MSQIIYGIHPVQEALKSNLQIHRILIGTDKPHPPLQALIEIARQKRIPVVFASRHDLEEMAPGGHHQNIVGVIDKTPYSSLEEILSRRAGKKERDLLLILDGIQDPQNLGSLIRTALGCGVQGVIIPKDRAAGITPSVIKASAGAVAHLPIIRVVNIANTIDALKKEGVWIFGASGEAQDRLFDLDLKIDLAIVIGAEGKGIRPLVKKKCDRLFSIPMEGPVSSFNASVSAGMILYEVMRQRHGTTLQAKSPASSPEGPHTSDASFR